MSKLISRNNNVIKYKDPSQKLDRGIDINPYIRNYQWISMPETEKQYKDYDTGELLKPGDKVWANEQGQMVTFDMPWAKEDWAVAHDRFAGSHELPELGIVLNKKTGERSDYILEQFEDYQQRMANAPIVSNTDLDKELSWAYDQYQDFKRQQYYNHLLNNEFNRQVDAVFVKAPLALLGLGIGGATALPYLVPGTIGGNIIGTTAFGEALNTAIKYGTGKTMGEHAVEAAHALGIPQSLWGDYGIQMLGDMPIYMTGDIVGKAVTNVGRTLGKEALDQIALNKSYFPTTKDLGKAMNKQVKNSTSKTFELFPGTIGWAPKQTITGVHASDNPNLKFDYNFLNWAEREHGAPKGIYFTANQKVPSGGFLNNRQYAYQVKSTFDKPIVQVGDIKTNTKNNIRNQIERAAMDLGADGIIYQDIADNNLKHQTIVKSLNPDQLVEITGVINRLNPKVTRVVDSNGTIRFQLDSHTPEMPREFVLDPQGDNKFYVHMRTWNGEKIPANMTDAEKNKLFESIYEELPEGAEILFPESSESYPATRGTVAGLIRLSRDPRFLRGNTTGTLIYTDKNGDLQTFAGNSFIKGKIPFDLTLQGFINNSSTQQNNTRYWKDSFGEEILEEPYPGSDIEILSALGKGMKYGIDYRKSPEHLKQILETMGWDDLAMSEYIQEQKDLIGRISTEVSGFDEGMVNKGKHRSELNENGKIIHLVLVNRDRMPTNERVIEAGVHEMGGHGMTGGISPEDLHGIYLQLAEKFPRTLELMLKNEQLKNQTLIYNDTMKEILTKKLYKKVEEWRKQGLTDDEIESKAILWVKFKNRKIPYISDTNEITTRAITENVIRNLGLTNSSSGKFNSLGMQEASTIFTPKSLEKFIKIALSNIGITYGLSQLDQPTSNKKGGKLIPRNKIGNR